MVLYWPKAVVTRPLATATDSNDTLCSVFKKNMVQHTYITNNDKSKFKPLGHLKNQFYCSLMSFQTYNTFIQLRNANEDIFNET